MGDSQLATWVIASQLYYRAAKLESQLAPAKESPAPGDSKEFWVQRQNIDDDVMFALSQLPQNLRLPRSSSSQRALFVNTLLHTAHTCLHKTAIRECHGLEDVDAGFMRSQSQSRMLAAAGQTLAIFRLSRDPVATLENPIQNHVAYIAALVFLEDFSTSGNIESKKSVIFLHKLLCTPNGSNPVARTISSQLAKKLESFGIPTETDFIEVRCFDYFIFTNPSHTNY